MNTFATHASNRLYAPLMRLCWMQWRAIEIRSKQLQNQCRQVVLDEELDREERELLQEHEQLLRIKEKQTVQQQYEDRFKLKEAEAAAKKLQRRNERQDAAKTDAVASAAATVAIVATASKTATATKSKSKPGVPMVAEEKKSKKKTVVSNVSGEKMERKKKAAAKSVAFSPRKSFPDTIPHGAHMTRPRRLEESFDTENEPEANERSVAKKSAADELMLMLSQDKASDTEGEEPSMASLLMPFSPAILSPVKNVPEPRYLSYGSPDRAEPKESNNSTPSKFTPSKLAKSVVKKAMAAPLDFDFTRKAAAAKAKAAKEKERREEAAAEEEEEQPTGGETPMTKKALKRRKDLGISFSDSASASTKTSANSNDGDGDDASNKSSRGGKSLMEMVTAASLVESKIPKLKEKTNQAKKDGAATKPSASSSASESGKPPLHDTSQSKQTAKATSGETGSTDGQDENAAAQSKAAKTTRKAANKDSKPRNSQAPNPNEEQAGSAGSNNEPETEDFIGLKAANITKRARAKQQKESGKAGGNAPRDEAEEFGAKKKKVAQDKPKEKGKKKDKLSAVEQAIAKADMLTRMSRMQDISTPKVLTKKVKKTIPKAAMNSLAAKRAEFQKILANGAAANDDDVDDETAGGPHFSDSGAFDTPRKQRAMKRQRAADPSGDGETTPVKKTAQAQPPMMSHLQSPSITALLAMRPSKSPIGIRYVPKTPKTPKTPQTVRSKRQRPVSSNAEDDASNNSPGAKQRRAQPNGAQIGAASMSAAEYATQRMNAGLVTRAKKKAVKAARSAFAGTTGALTSAGGGLWGNSGPSFFDAFVNGGAPRLKKSALR